MKPVLIVLQGGVADVRYAPAGVVVLIKDYDIQGCDGDEQCSPIHQQDSDGKDFHALVEEGPVGKDDQSAKKEAYYLMHEID